MKIPPFAPIIPIVLKPIAPPQHKPVEAGAVKFIPKIKFPELNERPDEIVLTDMDMILGRLKSHSDLHWSPTYLN